MNGELGLKEKEEQYIVRVRGLPFSASPYDVAVFFAGCDIKGGKRDGVHFLFNSTTGKPLGECFIEFLTAPDQRKALLQHHRYLGRRYLEVEEVTAKVMSDTLESQGRTARKTNSIARLRGLPFRTTEAEIEKFFAGLSISRQVIVKDPRGQAAGDGYVQFEDESSMKEALDKHMEKIGHRYIEVYEAYNVTDMDELPTTAPRSPRPGPPPHHSKQWGAGPQGYEGGEPWAQPRQHGGGNRLAIRMRGLPFDASEHDISDFFKPLVPTHIQLIYGRQNRPNGEAEVCFANHKDCEKALLKDKEYLGSRYVELFEEPSPRNSPTPHGYGGPQQYQRYPPGGAPPHGRPPAQRSAGRRYYEQR